MLTDVYSDAVAQPVTGSGPGQAQRPHRLALKVKTGEQGVMVPGLLGLRDECKGRSRKTGALLPRLEEACLLTP